MLESAPSQGPLAVSTPSALSCASRATCTANSRSDPLFASFCNPSIAPRPPPSHRHRPAAAAPSPGRALATAHRSRSLRGQDGLRRLPARGGALAPPLASPHARLWPPGPARLPPRRRVRVAQGGLPEAPIPGFPGQHPRGTGAAESHAGPCAVERALVRPHREDIRDDRRGGCRQARPVPGPQVRLRLHPQAPPAPPQPCDPPHPLQALLCLGARPPPHPAGRLGPPHPPRPHPPLPHGVGRPRLRVAHARARPLQGPRLRRRAGPAFHASVPPPLSPIRPLPVWRFLRHPRLPLPPDAQARHRHCHCHCHAHGSRHRARGCVCAGALISPRQT